ncbi:MAG: MMPL family transporter [Nocardioides sp.]|uniref:MMPL family transporter n=1 Tax=Nocardioides sp. TaxID=35761 RepID=UPI0039E2E3E6
MARLVVARPWWVIAIWLLLAVAGALGASRVTSKLTHDFGLPGQAGYEANQAIVSQFDSGGNNAPVLVMVHGTTVSAPMAEAVTAVVRQATPGARIAAYPDQPQLRSRDGRTAVILVYPQPGPPADPYAHALSALHAAVRTLHPNGATVTVTGVDAAAGGGNKGVGVLVEVLFGAAGALVVLVLVFGSLLALTPLMIAAASILTSFLALWGLTEVINVSFIVQYLLALIGLGVAIDYSLLIVTRWREERGRGANRAAAVETALATAGRSVLFSGVTVAVSLAALIALPVPYLRSVGLTGLLIPLVSVAAALTLLPAILSVAGSALEWPGRRSSDPVSPLWQGIARLVVRRRWWAAAASLAALLALAWPVLGLNLGTPSNASLASTGGPAATALSSLDRSGIGAGLTRPIEILTSDPARVTVAVQHIPGVCGVIAPASWAHGAVRVVDVWTNDDTSSTSGQHTAAAVRAAAERAGARVGGGPVQTSDFIHAVYGHGWWILGLIVVVTFALLARALHSIVLPVKALLLNTVSVAAAYGISVLIWQHGDGLHLLFDQRASDAITVWVPVAAFAFLFGLSMDYEVFLLSRIREEHDAGHDTAAATVRGVARTGRLVSSAALILFLAFVALSRVPDTDVKILATTLALGIALDATLVRGILAPALVAALGPANWWPTRHTPQGTPQAGHDVGAVPTKAPGNR